MYNNCGEFFNKHFQDWNQAEWGKCMFSERIVTATGTVLSLSAALCILCIHLLLLRRTKHYKYARKISTYVKVTCLNKLIHVTEICHIAEEFGGGNGNPLQYSCLENPVDRGAWWAPVHSVAQTQTWLKQLSMYACTEKGNGDPLQYPCLENPRDWGAWWAAVYGVEWSWTWMNWLSSNSSWRICIWYFFWGLSCLKY